MRRIDLMMAAHNRLEFTREALSCLRDNTDWREVRSLTLFDVASSDGTGALLRESGELFRGLPVRIMTLTKKLQIVDVMKAHWETCTAEFAAKIDNDTLVPPGWIGACLRVLDRHPELSLLGIESMYPAASPEADRTYRKALFIGGIGLFRRTALGSISHLQATQSYYGFQGWQRSLPHVIKGWLDPSLCVCLLDRIPFDPWARLTRTYVAKAWQRSWPPYGVESKVLWSWRWPDR